MRPELPLALSKPAIDKYVTPIAGGRGREKLLGKWSLTLRHSSSHWCPSASVSHLESRDEKNKNCVKCILCSVA